VFNLSVSPDLLSYVLAALAAILFDWFPGLSSWYTNLSEMKKRQVMAALLLGIVLLIYAGSCAGILVTGMSCDKLGFAALIQIYLVAIGINQGAHALFKPASNNPVAWRKGSDLIGQGMVEYALILVLVAVVAIAALSILGPLVTNVFSTINASL